MPNKTLKSLFQKAVNKIRSSDKLDNHGKVRALFHVFNAMMEEATNEEKISFTTLFSRIAYLGTKHKIPGKQLYLIHAYRRANEKWSVKNKNTSSYLALGYYVIELVSAIVWGEEEELPEPGVEIETFLDKKRGKTVSFQPVINAFILSVDPTSFTVTFLDEANGTEKQTALFDLPDKNEIFSSNIISLTKLPLPIHANLIDVEIMEDGSHHPTAIVILPDYLLDVTAVAECFKNGGADPMLYLIRKFKAKQSSAPLMIGNIANFFLDELVSDPEVSFKSLIPKIFGQDPVGFAKYGDNEVREILQKLQLHFLNIKKVIKTDFPEREIDLSNVYLEPAFYSRNFGMQGRLDLLHVDEEKQKRDIVELKSGKAFRPNIYGLSTNHYTQTLIYDLLIKSAFGNRINAASYILYSVEKERNLRYAPVVKPQQYEAMKIRNDLVSIEHKLLTVHRDEKDILSYIKPGNFPGAIGFIKKDIEQFYTTFSKLSLFEKTYFKYYTSFIAREHLLAKTGEHGLSKSNGLAALWLESIAEKEDRFSIFTNLEIKENNTSGDRPELIMSRTEDTNPLANFRIGDIAVLYPASDRPGAILHNQIFKCAILDITENEVVLRLRSKQHNHAIFKETKLWNVEEDSMDSGYNAMYKGLFQFASAEKQKRNLLLGLQSPGKGMYAHHQFSDELTEEQKSIINKVIQAEDYYLLWGPPGTGKTSMVLKHMVDYYYHRTHEHILLLAYTNKAVDEICAAIENLDTELRENYIRIGSRYACGTEYQDKLLAVKASESSSRKEIVEMIENCRVTVSTVSSIQNAHELLSLKSFDTVIVDEASQILEPMLTGLLPKFKKFILIGDYKQLPAVVQQNASFTRIKDELLTNAGIVDMRMSLFERMYLKAIREKWYHAIGILGAQGRMHKEVMQFPNEYFYSGKLQTIAGIERLKAERKFRYKDKKEEILVKERVIYIPTNVDEEYNWKTNEHEASKVSKVVSYIRDLYATNDKTIDINTIGIITPYRAQIAKIKSLIKADKIDIPITVDTVERYQGGARDIIILSLCTNKLNQLDALVSLSTEGIDRKLNVALTRAREQIIIIGNKEILETNETYKALIDRSYEWKG